MDSAEAKSHPIASPMTSAVTVETIVPLEVFELRYVLAVMRVCNDNKTRAAQLLGINRRSLYRLLERATALGMGA